MLTGHTLYNDASVVIRELVQDSIDAVRLEAYERHAPIDGTVIIHWNPSSCLLVIEDTGTGMTQEIVERHFLRAGSSRYQDTQFKKTHPGFSPISRFGIGVLSAFMISDEVEVFTVTAADEEKARKLTLRSLHGKYLIREYDRTSTSIPEHIRTHGTRISLRIREGAQPLSVLKAARQWIVFPPCRVTLHEEGSPIVVIGYESPKQAVEYTLTQLGFSLEYDPDLGQQKYSIREFDKQGLRLAVAVEWNRYFKEWTFLMSKNVARSWDDDSDRPLPGIGTCVEGIRIDSVTPGFSGVSLLAVANATGPTAPRTTVARSGFEATPERTEMLSELYAMYCNHISFEVAELHKSRNFSPTWAAGEAGYLAAPLLLSGETFRPTYSIQNMRLLDLQALESKVCEFPCLLLERGGNRDVVSIAEVRKQPLFWTIDSSGIRSIEELLREIPRPLSLSAISQLVKDDMLMLPFEPVLAALKEGALLQELALRNREADLIRVSESERRIDIRWRPISGRSIWKDLRTDDVKDPTLHKRPD